MSAPRAPLSGPTVADKPVWVRVVGVALGVASTWPLWHALGAVAEQEYVAALLLGGLAWLLGRTGVELAGLAAEPSGHA